MSALYRLALHAYPARFRREYGDAMQQTLRDQVAYEHRSALRVLTRELTDVARTAPRMRWESPMTRVVLIVLGATLAIAAVIAGGPLWILAVAAVVGFGLLVGAGRDRRVEATLHNRRWVPWAIVAVIGIGAAVAIAQLADGELSEVWWSVMALCGLVGIASAVVAALIAVTHHRSDGAASPRSIG